jgi:arginyl-tRNA synthetase
MEVLSELKEKQEVEIIRHIAALQNEIESAAKNYDPSKITKYAIDLATLFHKFYDACSVKNANTEEIKHSRFILCVCVKQILKNILIMLKIDCPEKM